MRSPRRDRSRPFLRRWPWPRVRGRGGRAAEGPEGARRPQVPARRAARRRPRVARGRRPRRSAHLLRGHGLGRRLEVARTAASSWKPIFDDQPMSSIGSIAVAPSDPNVVYVGSGEANIRGNVAPGNGIYKSTDAGKTWKHVWKQDGQIGTMVVHPTNPDVAFAAVLGKRLRPEPRARRLPHARRRQDLAAGALQGRGHRRLRRRARPAQPAHRLRRALAGAAPAVGADERRPRQRPLRLARRRRHLEAAHAATACPRASGARSASRSRPRTPRRVYALSRPRRAGSSARTTAARPGRSRAATARCGSGPGTTRRSPSTRRTPTSSGSRRCRC